ncbi:MAG TPA: NAD-dependent epimerase/dehydratase family protein [Parafilimonas sp.]|nr:NAD-dependent epimerase/dehydratase family protein [Parafilimonas sp.]
MKKIQVIGGSGFIGANLLKEIGKTHAVNNIDKNNSQQFSAITTIADIRDKEKLTDSLQPSEWVVLLAAEHRDDISPASLYYNVNVDGTKNVLSAMNEKDIRKIIFTSSVAVYGLNKKNPDEQFKEDPFNDYGKSKWQAEEVLRNWYNEDPQNRTLIIIRPTVVFGPDNKGNVYTLLKQIASGKFLMIGKGNNKKSMAYVENLVGFIKYTIDNNFSGYHLYNYVDKPDYSMTELIAVSEKSLNKKLPAIKVPYTIGYLGGICFDVISFITRKKFSISSVRIKKFCATTQFSSDKMLSTGYKPVCTLEEGLTKTLNTIK